MQKPIQSLASQYKSAVKYMLLRWWHYRCAGQSMRLTQSRTEKIAVAKAALRCRAEQSGAPQLAPVDLATARDKLARARKKAQADHDMKTATALAEQANIDAQVAGGQCTIAAFPRGRGGIRCPVCRRYAPRPCAVRNPLNKDIAW